MIYKDGGWAPLSFFTKLFSSLLSTTTTQRSQLNNQPNKPTKNTMVSTRAHYHFLLPTFSSLLAISSPLPATR